MDDTEHKYAHEMVWEGDDGSSFTANDRLVIVPDLHGFPMTIPASDCKFDDLL